jgi:preprotein translocase subunit SecA
MEEGQAIESGMVSRRIQAAQKKVEERNFDIRKHLLEYDEVMDHQRKKVYGFRQEILDGANCKLRVVDMLAQQLDLALDRYLDDSYGPSSFAELVSQKLNIECSAEDFARCSFEEADRVARDKAFHMIQTMIQEAMDENLDTEIDASEWNWQAMADRVNKLWDLKTNDRQLKKIGRDNLAEFLIKEAEGVVKDIDLTKGTAYLEPGWGIRSLCTWFDLKFQIRLDPARLDPEQGRESIRQILLGEVQRLYRQKEIEFPVSVAMARFMHEHGGVAPGQRYNREGLFHWYVVRYAQHQQAGGIPEEDFRTQSRAKLLEALIEVSRQSFPAATQDDLDVMLRDAFEGAQVAEEADAQEMSTWVKEKLALDVPAQALVGLTFEGARDLLWNAYDERYRPEMKRMERSLLLGRLDMAWKNHLLTMDHLRQGIGLVGYAQIDPKTEFKRVGMKEFDTMWEGLSDKVTDVVFRMEDDEAFAESVWAIGAMIHESAPQLPDAPVGSIQDQQQQAIAGSQQTDRKPEPIRNRGERVGRNDPCTCGSGKKYKNCCMRLNARK